MDYLDKIKVKAPKTQVSIKSAIKNLELFNSKTITNDNIYDILQNWINWNFERDLNPKSIKLYFEHLKPYFYHLGFKLYREDIKQQLVFPKSYEEEKHPLSLDEIQKILEAVPYRKKALYLLLISSGMRIGEATQIRKTDIDLSLKRPAIRILARITKTRRGRTTFMSSEAWKFLQPIYEKATDYLFGTKQHTEDALFNRYCEKIGLTQTYESGIRKITLHSFRAYFITRISRFDENLAKKLAGQKGYQLQYDRLTDAQKCDLYTEFERDLLIFDTTKLKQDLAKAKSEQITAEFLQEQIKELQEFKKLTLEIIRKNEELTSEPNSQ